ncbi:MAG: uroporphyrinogen decarboxylase [Chloroflexi bacterium]|nr:uroporphyrinogen decarboxylase [Chloroflexota bacterium]
MQTEQTNPPSPDAVINSRFLKACRREPVDATPIWLMRQAGRYMAQYQAVRQKYSLLELIEIPEVAVEVTLQPLDAYELDAAIIFADILPLIAAMGLDLEFVKGEGPVIHNPVRTAADVENLRVLPPEEAVGFTLEAIKLIRPILDGRGLPLIGFSGAPFSLAGHALEGGQSKDFLKLKGMMMAEPELWDKLMTKLSDAVGQYLLAQAHAGVQALQLFDSSVGTLSPEDYRNHVLPYSKRAIDIARQANVPILHFGLMASGMVELIRDAGGDVISVDWRIRLDDAWERLGPNVGIQGNLDPVALFAPWEALRTRTAAVLDQVKGRPGHIFNLGHGILQQTPVDNVKRLAEFVHTHTNGNQIS